MPFDIERFSIPINSPSYNEAKSFDSYISSFCVLIVAGIAAAIAAAGTGELLLLLVFPEKFPKFASMDDLL